MLTFNLFSLFTGVINRHFRGRRADAQLRQELLAHRRRELLHQHIPDVYAARAAFGPRFEELHKLLRSHDPAGLKKSAAESPYYPELARTLLYQLAPTQTSEQMRDILQQELSLWFGYPARQAAPVQQFADELYQWRVSW